MEPDLWYQTRMGQGPKRIAHIEHFSNPDAATYITGIDFYDHPRTCITRLNDMYEFAELSRRAFKAMSRLPLHFLGSHDDIVMPTGPVCSPDWMHKHIFPRYEEYWGYCRAAGKRVYMTVDGCIDAYVDDVMACGASGFTTEPFTDFKAIARKGDNG